MPAMWRAASSPSIPGMRMSSSTTSGWRRFTSLYCLHAVRRLTHDVIARNVAQHARQPIARELLIVDYEYLHRL